MKVVGIMSGTSMDGVDLCLTDIQYDGKWTYNIIATKNVSYEEKWRVRLSQLRYQFAELYAKTDVFYGKFLGEQVLAFLNEINQTADLISSHGHTIFHDPAGWLTAQIGDGETLSAVCGIPVVTNFRRADVALGGQGAPLVGIGDDLFFSEYDLCLNLGGFSNISASQNGSRVAFDVSPCNIILNRLAREKGLKYDEDGLIAENGEILYPLLERLNAIPYYSRSYPKSLGREWINKEFWHVVRDFDKESTENRMKTLVLHIAQQVANSVDLLCGDNGNGKKMLVSGGGVHNACLMDYLRTETDAEIVVPENQLIDYKEALIFALLGAMRVHNQNNTLNTATGASKATVGGSLHGNFAAFK